MNLIRGGCGSEEEIAGKCICMYAETGTQNYKQKARVVCDASFIRLEHFSNFRRSRRAEEGRI